MLTIRLSRVGKKKQPTYRLIISEKSKDTFGDFLEILGHYNPLTEPRTINLKEGRIKYWLEKGAQTSPTVHNLLVDAKIIKGPKVKASKNKKKEGREKEIKEKKIETKEKEEAKKK